VTALVAQSSISAVMVDVFADFLTAIDGATALPITIFGPRDSEANMMPPGVYWTPGQEVWNNPQRQGMPGYPSSLWVREIPIHILIFGGENAHRTHDGDTPPPSTNLRSTDVTEWMIEALVNAFHRRLSQHGYQITGGTWGEGTREGIGLAFDMTVTVRLPLVRLDNPTVTIESVKTTVEFATHD
jgi:hypothetical protein